jgi:hypothetical protein
MLPEVLGKFKGFVFVSGYEPAIFRFVDGYPVDVNYNLTLIK